MTTDADELVRLWLVGKLRNHVPPDAGHLHYRDCPRLVVEGWESFTYPLSEVTPDEYTSFDVRWGCVHGPERMRVTVNAGGATLPELISELSHLDDGMLDRQAAESRYAASPGAFCRGYPAGGEGGTVYAPD